MLKSPSIVVCYHGCDQSVADRVIKHDEHIQESKNSFFRIDCSIYQFRVMTASNESEGHSDTLTMPTVASDIGPNHL